jgi:hypothetical protein
MCKYKRKPIIVDADQYICDQDKDPEVILPGVYKKTWEYDTGGEKIFHQWGIDGMFNFISLRNGDWIVRYPDEKWVRVYSNEEFQDKFETLAWPDAWAKE